MPNFQKMIVSIQICLISIFISSSAFAINPSRTCVCLILQCEMKKLTPIFSNSKYSMNSIQSFRENRLKIKEINPGIAQGYIFQEASQTSKSFGFNTKKAAARLRGIEYFSETSGEDKQKKTIQSVVITGEEEISKFLNDFKVLVNTQGQTERRELMRSYGFVYIFAFGFEFLTDPKMSSDPLRAAGIIAAFTSYHSFKYYQELIPFDFISNEIQTAMSNSKSSWSLLSTDIYLSKNYEAEQAEMDDSIGKISANESNNKVYYPFYDTIKKIGAIWLATDFFFEKGENQEPELHIILRTSKGRPVLPKKQKDSEKNVQGKSSDSGSGIWAPEGSR